MSQSVQSLPSPFLFAFLSIAVPFIFPFSILSYFCLAFFLLFFAMFCLRSNDWLGQLNRWFCAARLCSLRKPLPACLACQTSFAFVTRLRIPFDSHRRGLSAQSSCKLRPLTKAIR